MSDDDLPAQLVTAVAKAIAEADIRSEFRHASTSDSARAAAVATLRTLAADAEVRYQLAEQAANQSTIEMHRANYQGERAAEGNASSRFSEWADRIERGEADV